MSIRERKGLHTNHFKLNIRCPSRVTVLCALLWGNPRGKVSPVSIRPQQHPLLGSRHWRADPGVTAAPPAPSASHLSSDNLQNLPTGLWRYFQYSSVIDHLPGPSSPHSLIFAWSLLSLIDREIEASLSASYILSLDHNCQLPMFSFAGAPPKPLRALLPLRMTQHVIFPIKKNPFRDTFWYINTPR